MPVALLDWALELGPETPLLVISEVSWSTTDTAKSVVVSSCDVGDQLIVFAGGDQSSSSDVTACTTSTIAGPGTTDTWEEPREALDGGDDDWVSVAETVVTGAGDVTVQVSRTMGGTAGGWGFFVVRARNTGGIGNIAGITASGSATTISLAVGDYSAVVFFAVDWNAGTIATTFTPDPSNVTIIERSVQSDYTVHAAYWPWRPAGTTSYGFTGGAGSKYRLVAIEILPPSSGTTHNVNQTDDVGVTDAIRTQDQTLVRTDSVGVTDRVSQDQTLVRTHTVGVTDSVGITESNLHTDSVGVTDEVTTQLTTLIVQSFTDNIGVTDNVSKSFIDVLRDSVNLTDSRALTQHEVRTDSIGVIDTAGLSETNAHTSSVGITDSVTVTVSTILNVAVTDDIGLADALFKTQAKTFIAPVGLFDTRLTSLHETYTDSVGITDSITVFNAQLTDLQITDSIGITDRTMYSRTVVQRDTVGVSDRLLRTQAESYTDAIGLSDPRSIGKLLERAPTDSVGVTDKLQRQYSLVRLDTVTVAERLLRTVTYQWYETVGITDAADATSFVPQIGPTVMFEVGPLHTTWQVFSMRLRWEIGPLEKKWVVE